MTPHQLAVLDLVRSDIGAIGLAPSIREIADRLGGGVANTHRTVDALVDQGKLRRSAAKKRNLELADAPDLRLADSQALRAELARRGETVEAMQARGPVPRKWAPYCAADGCDIRMERRGHLMCRAHWLAVPRDLRDGILDANARRDAERFGLLLLQARDAIAGVRGGR